MSPEVKFEKALEKLEKIVEDLESGDVALEDALKLYEEGVKLSRSCQSKLSEAEKRIEILTKNMTGELSREPFNPEETDIEEDPPAKKKKSRKSGNGEDVLL